MQTLTLQQAAKFLHMNHEVLRRKARAGEIPGRKAGKQWVFVEEHLADWVSGRYPDFGRELRVIDNDTKEENSWQSTNAGTSGGYDSPSQTESQYKNLLGLE